MLEGKLNAHVKEYVLVDQDFIVANPPEKVGKALARIEKETGTKLTIAFNRMSIGSH